MTTAAADIAKWIGSNIDGCILADGTNPTPNLFWGALPDEPDDAIVIYDTGGMAPERVLGTHDIDRENPNVQVNVRSTVLMDGLTLIRAIWRAIGQLQNTVLVPGGSRYIGITPLQSPFVMRVDEKFRRYFTFNAAIDKEP